MENMGTLNTHHLQATMPYVLKTYRSTDNGFYEYRRPTAHFQTKLYTGNGADNHAITNDGNSDLAADLVWIKYRTAGVSHVLYDSSRGATKDYTQILMDKKQHKLQVLNLLTVMVLHLDSRSI